jgi:hypothetical protein
LRVNLTNDSGGTVTAASTTHTNSVLVQVVIYAVIR